MRTAFVGTMEFIRHRLKDILRNDGKVVAVLPLTKERAGFHSDYADLSDVAIRRRMEYAEAFTLIWEIK